MGRVGGDEVEHDVGAPRSVASRTASAVSPSSTSSAPSSSRSARRRSSVSTAITVPPPSTRSELERDVPDAADADHGRRSSRGARRGSSLLTAW